MAKAHLKRPILVLGVIASLSVGVVDALVVVGNRHASSDAAPDTSAITKFLTEAQTEVTKIAKAEKAIVCDVTTDPTAPPQDKVKAQAKLVADADTAMKIVVAKEKDYRSKVKSMKSDVDLKVGEIEDLNKALATLRSEHQKAQVRASDSLMEVASVLDRAAKNQIRLQDAKAADAALHRGKLSSEVSLLKQLGDQLADSSENQDEEGGAMNFLQVRSSRPLRKESNTSGAAALLLEADRRALLAASVAQLRDFREEEQKLMKMITDKRKELKALEATLGEQRALLAESVREMVERKDALEVVSGQSQIFEVLLTESATTCTLRNQTEVKVAGMREAVLAWIKASFQMLKQLAKETEDASFVLKEQAALKQKYASLYQVNFSDAHTDLNLEQVDEASRNSDEAADADADADEDVAATTSSESSSSISMMAPISVLDNDDEESSVDPKQMAALQQASEADFASLAEKDSESAADDQDFNAAETLSAEEGGLGEDEDDDAQSPMAPSLVQLGKSVKQQGLGEEVARALAEAEGNRDSDAATLLEESAGSQSDTSAASSASQTEQGQSQGPFDSVVALIKQLIDEIQDQSNKDANKDTFCQNAETENSRNRVRAKTALHQSQSLILKSAQETKRLEVLRKQMEGSSQHFVVMEQNVVKQAADEKKEQKAEYQLGHSLKVKATTAVNMMEAICHQRQALLLDVGDKTAGNSRSSTSVDFCAKTVETLKELKLSTIAWSAALDEYREAFALRAKKHAAIVKAAVKSSQEGYEDQKVKQAKLKKDLAEAEADLKKQKQELANLAKALTQLKDQCTVKETIDDRIARLTDQIEKLRGALRVLGGEDIPV